METLPRMDGIQPQRSPDAPRTPQTPQRMRPLVTPPSASRRKMWIATIGVLVLLAAAWVFTYPFWHGKNGTATDPISAVWNRLTSAHGDVKGEQVQVGQQKLDDLRARVFPQFKEVK